MGPKLRQLVDGISEVIGPDGFTLGKTFRDYIPFRKEQDGLFLEYNFDVLTKYGLCVEARIEVRHHQTEEIYNGISPVQSTEPDAALRTCTLFASVGRIAAGKQPFWNIFKDPLAARVSLRDADDVAKAIKKQKELYLKYVRDTFAEIGSLSGIEQHLNRKPSKEALYAEDRLRRATRGIITGKLCNQRDLAQLIAAHRAALYHWQHADFDKFVDGFQSYLK